MRLSQTVAVKIIRIWELTKKFDINLSHLIFATTWFSGGKFHLKIAESQKFVWRSAATAKIVTYSSTGNSNFCKKFKLFGPHLMNVGGQKVLKKEFCQDAPKIVLWKNATCANIFEW